MVSGYAPFDAWVDGDDAAVPDAAKRGFGLFTGKAHCSNCHVGWAFTDNKFHDIGSSSTDVGRSAVEPANPFAAVRLQDAEPARYGVRAPYMHDGQYDTLAQVVDHYVSKDFARPSRSVLLQKVALSPTRLRTLWHSWRR